jgi:hypothetical protein
MGDSRNGRFRLFQKLFSKEKTETDFHAEEEELQGRR